MEQVNEEFNESVQLLDGDYLAVLGVYHQLHCLVCLSSCIRCQGSNGKKVILTWRKDRLRRVVHMEHYFPNLTETELHEDYSLEHLGQVAINRQEQTSCSSSFADYTQTIVSTL